MGRKPRIEFNGALYHIIQRGNNKETLRLKRPEKGLNQPLLTLITSFLK